MALDPKLRKDSRGVWWLDWTRDPQAMAYDIVTPAGLHVQAGRAAISSKLGKQSEPFSAQIAPAYAQGYEKVSQPPVTVPPVTPPGGLSYESVTDWDDEFAAVRNLTFMDKNGLLNLIAGRQPGDLIRYAGSGDLLIDQSSDTFRGYCVRSAGDIRIELGHPNEPHVIHRFTGQTAYSAVLLAGASHLHLRGGEVSTPNGGAAGIAVRGGYDGITDHLSWEGFLAQECGTDGIDLFPNHPGTGALSEISDWSFKGVAKRVALTTAWDPHVDKGTGVHCANTWDVKNGRLLRGRLAIDGYDSQCGSVIECGTPSSPDSRFEDITYYFRGTRLKLVPTSQTAGNGLQFWGGVPINLTVGWAELIDSTGAVIHGYGTPGAGWDTGSIIVEHGRHQNVNQSSAADNIDEPYDSRYHIVYRDCT